MTTQRLWSPRPRRRSQAVTRPQPAQAAPRTRGGSGSVVSPAANDAGDAETQETTPAASSPPRSQPARRRASTSLENLSTGGFQQRLLTGGAVDGPNAPPAANDGGDVELPDVPRATEHVRVSMSDIYPERNDAVLAHPRSSAAAINPLHSDDNPMGGLV